MSKLLFYSYLKNFNVNFLTFKVTLKTFYFLKVTQLLFEVAVPELQLPSYISAIN